jgi:hypothetical protein
VTVSVSCFASGSFKPEERPNHRLRRMGRVVCRREGNQQVRDLIDIATILKAQPDMQKRRAVQPAP